jgi:hypothetical protein
MGTVIRFAALGAAGVPRPAQSHSTLYRSTGPVDDAAFQPRPDLRAVRCWASSRSILFVMCLLIECFYARHAEAELGPCTTAAPATPNVISFVSDIDRSARWYRDNVGLAEASKPDIAERHDNQVREMTRNQAGVTLIPFGGASGFSRDVQMMCFLLERPPAPSPGSPPLFLVDPDGTSIELPAFPGPVQQ